MPDLSPQAQAVLNALLEAKFGKGAVELGFPVMSVILGRELAAALRAAADQVVPEQSEPPCGEGEPWPQRYQLMADSKWEQRQQTRIQLLTIAAELEGIND